jgi:hypothetical protein
MKVDVQRGKFKAPMIRSKFAILNLRAWVHLTLKFGNIHTFTFGATHRVPKVGDCSGVHPDKGSVGAFAFFPYFNLKPLQKRKPPPHCQPLPFCRASMKRRFARTPDEPMTLGSRVQSGHGLRGSAG